MKYKVFLSTKINVSSFPKGSGIIVIEPEDYTVKEIKDLKNKGYKVLGYLSIGTIEKDRSFYKTYAKFKKKRLPDWPREFYMDMTKREWTNFLIKHAKELKKEKGVSGWWLDNLDVYEEYKCNATFKACYQLLKDIKAIGGYVMVNGGSQFFDDVMSKHKDPIVNGVTQEEVFSLIKDYSGKGKFGEQKKDMSSWYKKYLKRLKKFSCSGFLLEYTRDDKLKKKIKDWCKEYGMSYYISEDVNL